MFEIGKKIRIADVIDIDFLQKVQDAFAKALDMASMTVDDEGAVTKPSNFTDFCKNFVRPCELGQKRCNECDIRLGKMASLKGEPVMSNCHTGLIDIAVPVIVAGQHVASILIGQVLTEPIDEEKFREYARELGVDEEGYVNAAKKINIMPKEKIHAAAELISLVANSISSIGHRNLELKLLNERETFLRSAIEDIRSSLDIDATKKKIVQLIGKSFSADRCYIAEYDKLQDKFLLIKDEYKNSDCVDDYDGIDINEKGPNFVELLKARRPIFVKNKQMSGLQSDNSFEQELQTIEEFNINSIVSFPLFHGDDLLGVLTLHYLGQNDGISEDAVDTISIIADQVALAIYQAKLFKATQISAEREKLIAKILTRTISTFNMSQIKQILSEIGIMTKADRCFFVELDVEGIRGIPVASDCEYLDSSDIKSIVGYSFPPEDVEVFINMWLKSRDLIVFDYERFQQERNQEFASIIQYSSQFDLKSGIGIPFYDGGVLKAILAIEYVRENVKPSEDELNFLRILGNQAGLVFKQIQLYQNTKKIANREMLMRKVIESMRSSLDINIIKNTIVTEVGKAFDADVCLILSYDADSDKFYVGEFSEYRKTQDEKSHLNVTEPTSKATWFYEAFRNNRECNFSNAEDFIEENNLGGTRVEEFIRDYNIKSGYHISIYYANKVQGYIIINYTGEYHKLSDEMIDSLRSVATQAGIAFHQAKLYATLQMQAEREKISRSIVEILRSTIDKKTIKHLFVKNIGKFFNADRVFFSDYDSGKNMYLPVDKDSEYLSGPDVRSFVGYDWTSDEAREYIQPLLEKRELNVYCWDDYIKKNPKGQNFINLFEQSNTKSSYNLPVLYQGRIMGYFCIEYARESCKNLQDEDINRIRNMCTQAGIALYHAELYEQANELSRNKGEYMTKMSSECMSPLRSIVELSGALAQSELDKDKQTEIVSEINKIANGLLEKVTVCNQNGRVNQ